MVYLPNPSRHLNSLSTLIPKDKTVVFVTNNATKSRRSYKSKFDQLGVQAHVVSVNILFITLNWSFIGSIGRNLRICICRSCISFLRHQASKNKKGLCHWNERFGGRTPWWRYHNHRGHGSDQCPSPWLIFWYHWSFNRIPAIILLSLLIFPNLLLIPK